MLEPWMTEAKLQQRWDERMSRRPVCADCRRPIDDEEFLPMEDGAVCPRCVRRRMVRIPDDGTD